MSGLDHGEDPGFHGIGKYVPGGDDGCQLGIMRSLPRAICAGFCAALNRSRVVKKLKRADGPPKYEFGTLKMVLFSAELSV